MLVWINLGIINASLELIKDGLVARANNCFTSPKPAAVIIINSIVKLVKYKIKSFECFNISL